MEAWAREQAAAGHAPGTVALRLAAVSSAYIYALHGGLVDRSRVAHVRRPKLTDDSPTLGWTASRPARCWWLASRATAVTWPWSACYC